MPSYASTTALHAVADVIDGRAVQAVVRRVRKRRGCREGIEHEREPPVVSDDDVRVGIEGEEGRERPHALADSAPHQQAAVCGDVVTEREPGQVPSVERDEDAAQKPAEDDASGALVRRDAVGLALRVVEFLLTGAHVDVGVGQLAEIDFRPRHFDGRHARLNRHVLQDERRQAFGREAVHRVHGHAVPVRVDQLLVDPVPAALGQAVDVELARGEHHLPHRAVDLVPIDVDVGEVVVRADLLDLAQRVLQGAPVPQPDVLQRLLVVGDIDRFDTTLGGKRMLRDAVECVRLPRQL